MTGSEGALLSAKLHNVSKDVTTGVYKDLGAACLRSKEVLAGVALQEGPLGGLPLQQVGG